MSANQAHPVHAIVLAAGAARRFGAPKLLASLEGRPILAHVLEALADLRTHVVLRDDAPAPLRALVPAGSRVLVPALTADDGMASSLRAGLRSAESAGAAAVLCCLGDQPRLRRDVLAALVGAWRGGHEAVRPRYADEPEVPGHPLLLDRRHFALAARLAGDAGFGPVLRDAALPVHVVDVPGRNPDLDTPDDLARL